MLNSLISEVRLLRSGIRTMYGDPGAAQGAFAMNTSVRSCD